MKAPARGVSLLEMLVALTILASAGGVLFGWVYQASGQLRRLNTQQLQAMAQLQALQFLKGVNPAATSSGRQRFTTFELSWDAKPTTPARLVLDANDAPLNQDVAVYRVDVTLRQGKLPDLQFQTLLPGWRSTVGGAGADFDPGIAGRVGK